MKNRKLLFFVLIGISSLFSVVGIRIRFEPNVEATALGVLFASILLISCTVVDGIAFASVWWLFDQARCADPNRIANGLTVSIPIALGYTSLVFVIFRGTFFSTVSVSLPKRLFSFIIFIGVVSLFLVRVRPNKSRVKSVRYWGMLGAVFVSGFYLGVSLSPADAIILIPLGVTTWLLGVLNLSGRRMAIAISFASFLILLGYLGAWFASGFVSAKAAKVLLGVVGVLLAMGFVIKNAIDRVEESIPIKEGRN